MSECKRKQFEFRQPVSVQVKGRWYPGAYLHYNESAGEHVAMWSEDGRTNGKINWFPCGQIKPDPYHCLALVPTATPRTGWRLPVPGDVVRIKPEVAPYSGKEGVIDVANSTHAIVKFSGGFSYSYHPVEMELIRLHDAPQPEPAQEPRTNKQDIIDNAKLELAAVTLEQDGHDHVALMLRDLKRDWGES